MFHNRLGYRDSDVLPNISNGIDLTATAYAAFFLGGDLVVTFGLSVFAFTTMIG